MEKVEKQLNLNERLTTHLSDAALHTMAALAGEPPAWTARTGKAAACHDDSELATVPSAENLVAMEAPEEPDVGERALD